MYTHFLASVHPNNYTNHHTHKKKTPGDLTPLEGEVVVRGSIAYVAQSAWIQNATLRSVRPSGRCLLVLFVASLCVEHAEAREALACGVVYIYIYA